MVLKVFSPDEQISNILLKKRVPQRNVKLSLLMNFHKELKLAYEDFRDSPVILNNTPSFFEYASFVFEKERGSTILRRLHIGNIVLIDIENDDNLAIIRALFYHQKNDLQFAFIVVNWFEKLNRTMLDCPLYRLQTINTNNCQRIFSISLVSAINNIHFIHCCKDEEFTEGDHNLRNELYMRNLYFFKAV
ncbi:hypothetical protein GLOIN_2v1474421 [Rhizophagus clarus]|uniref:Uncharacterized protein n=1 Tax=Rhizophagus clarus TaxID=94130 RepID=A0A8H3LZ51_9GLOM|nr:hypothetical protein GLOIN_2v1474421 [Rhizophagus clarus]